MKLKNLRAVSVGGLSKAHMRLEESVSVIVGPPSSGKTSVCDALAAAVLGRATFRGGARRGEEHLRHVEVAVDGSRLVESAAGGPDYRARGRVIGDFELLEVLLDPELFLSREGARRKRLVVGSVQLDAATLVGRLRALGIPGHHGVVDATVGNIPSALARVRAALREVRARRVVVSEPEDPVVETPRGTCRVSALPPVADLHAVLAPLLKEAEAAGANLPAAGAGDVVALAARRAEHAAAALMARQLEQEALGWTEADDRAYEARIQKTESAKGAIAVAEERAMAAAESIAYLAELEDADAESLPTCPTCRNRPSDTLRPTLLRHRAAAANDHAAASKALWEARQVMKALEASNAAIEARAAAFTVAEEATSAARREAEESKRVLETLVASEAEQEKARKELASLRERVSRGQTLIALRSTYDSAMATFATAEASRLAIDAEAQRYMDAERMLVAAAEGESEVELGSVVGDMNHALSEASVALFEAPGAVMLTDDWEVTVRGVGVEHVSTAERLLAAIACGHALAMLSTKAVLCLDGLERIGYEHVDRVLAWLGDVGTAYDNLIVTIRPNGHTAREMAEARTLPVERPHIRYYHIDTPGVVEPVLEAKA